MVNFLPSKAVVMSEAVMLQYKRLANFYFLAVATLTTIPVISPLNPAQIWFGVVSVLAVSILKEGTFPFTQVTRTTAATKSTKTLTVKKLLRSCGTELCRRWPGDNCMSVTSASSRRMNTSRPTCS